MMKAFVFLTSVMVVGSMAASTAQKYAVQEEPEQKIQAQVGTLISSSTTISSSEFATIARQLGCKESQIKELKELIDTQKNPSYKPFVATIRPILRVAPDEEFEQFIGITSAEFKLAQEHIDRTHTLETDEDGVELINADFDPQKLDDVLADNKALVQLLSARQELIEHGQTQKLQEFDALWQKAKTDINLLAFNDHLRTIQNIIQSPDNSSRFNQIIEVLRSFDTMTPKVQGNLHKRAASKAAAVMLVGGQSHHSRNASGTAQQQPQGRESSTESATPPASHSAHKVVQKDQEKPAPKKCDCVIL